MGWRPPRHWRAGLLPLLQRNRWAHDRNVRAAARASLRHADAIYVAAAERHHTALLTADARIEHSGVPVTCRIITITSAEQPPTP